MNIIQWNARGIKNKRPDILFAPIFQKASILIIQETWLHPNDIFTIPNKNIFRIDREIKRGGGLMIVLNKDISAIKIFSEISEDLEILIVRVQIDLNPITIFNIYIPPGNFQDSNLSKIASYIDNHNLILGDFNASHEIWGSKNSSASGKKIFDWIIENDLILLNDKSPTYLHSSGIFTSIDLSLASIDLNYDLSWSTNTDNFGSDHFPIIINYKRANRSVTTNCKQNTNWNKFINIIQQNINLNENINIDIIKEIKKAQILSQGTEKNLISSRAPWWTAACGHLRAKKRKLLNKARKNFKEEDWIKYKAVSAKLKRTIKACKENFWHKTCEKISSPKVLFKIIRIIKNRTNSNYSSFNIIENNGTILTNEQSQANCFLQYYAKRNNDSIPNISIPDNSQDINKPFSLKELEIAISHQKNSSPGHDKISLQSINHLPIKAIYLLLKSFNDSWFSSQIPKDWTHALILPFIKPHKNPKEVSSYRPISLTSVIAKLLERMILHRMLDFSFQNKIFHVNHHGFYPHRSSINTLLQLQHDIILARERKEYFILVALDIKAAYDSVWPNGLISKLNKVGYSGRLLRWIQNFLHQRTIQIKWRNIFSKIVTNNYGVPQGSILSPFLFMIYMSDIFEIQHDSHLLVYADDIFLYNSGTNWNKTIGEMQESLNKISVWCKKWKLSTSPEKSSLLNFSRKRSTIPPLLKICDKPIPEVKSLKILGIIFDPNTTWKNHINYLRQKGFKYLNAIKALSSPKIGTRSDHLLNIINATIRSIFDYGSQLFSFSSNSNRQKLEPIYNAALRLALGLPRNTPLDLLRAESMNGNINSRHNFLCQKFITKQIALKDWSPNARLFWNIDSNFYKYREKEISIFQKTINLLQELCISKVDILQWIPPPPIYDNRKINIYTHELPFQNKDLPDDIVQNMFNDYIQPKFNNNIIIATDGSKNTNQTSIGILIPKKKNSTKFHTERHDFNIHS
ncbi:probable RNA-directed DNA polymerase from transposon BS [Trichonephila clavipes]|uniref:Probable RNA-directed DNA polymerase from transposon BS n=2 Tax=Trichonephila clavipes TaxID=2585209 RepID=A0A8X6RZB5_TRICX|nr:probable RNA-directed DNA polymerase from transposon BS [Trichonephila clavipes]